MLKRLFDQVVGAISSDDENDRDGEQREHAIRMATAVLMVDVARADHEFDDAEHDDVLQLIETQFALEAEVAAGILNDASERAEDLVSLHEFTQLLHENLDSREKERVVGMLWRVAYADGTLDKFEDSLVLKISDLLHVQRARVMRLKHDAAQAAGAA
jgi:uncharacterized tellurite resistance protein B-like protein